MERELDELLETHGPPTLVYLVCRALGLPARKAARWAGFSETTGRRREAEPWWPKLFEAMRGRLRHIEATAPPDVEQALLPLLPDAIHAYEQALDEADRSVARDVLDRLFGKPSTRPAKELPPQKLPPLLIYERVDPTSEEHPASPPAGAGGVHRQQDAGSDV